MWCTDLWSIFSPQSLYRMTCPLVARRMNTLLTTFVVNVPWLVPFSFFHSHGISTLNVVRLSHTLQHFSSSCLSHLFIDMVAVNATISSELLNARSLTRGRIHDVTLRPTYVHVKKFNAKQAKSSSFIVISLAWFVLKMEYSCLFSGNQLHVLSIFVRGMYALMQRYRRCKSTNQVKATPAIHPRNESYNTHLIGWHQRHSPGNALPRETPSCN